MNTYEIRISDPTADSGQAKFLVRADEESVAIGLVAIWLLENSYKHLVPLEWSITLLEAIKNPTIISIDCNGKPNHAPTPTTTPTH